MPFICKNVLSDPDLKLSDTSRSMSTSERGDSEAPVRAWTAQDREDLTKLGSMMQHFLRMPQFSAEQRYFSSLVIAPLMDSDGPLPGAVQALSQVMESVMIRHRYVDLVLLSEGRQHPDDNFF